MADSPIAVRGVEEGAARPSWQRTLRLRRVAVTPQFLLFAILLAVFAYLIVPPLVTVIQTGFSTVDAFGNAGSLTLANYTDLLFGRQFFPSLLNTLEYALGSSLIALIIGGGLALISERTNAPLRGLGGAVAFLALAIPYVLYAIAWVLILGQRGPANTLLVPLLHLSHAPLNPYNLWAMIAIEGFLWSSLAFLLLSGIFRSMDPALEEAALTSGAGIRLTLTRVTLPIARPALLAVALLALIGAVESFEIPALVGVPGGVFVLASRVYIKSESFPRDYGQASAYGGILMLLVMAGLYFYARATRQSRRFATISGKGFRPRLIDLGRWRLLAGTAILLYFILLLVLPVGLIVWASLMPFYTPPGAAALHLLTFKNYAALFHDPSFIASIENTLVIGVVSATGILLLSLLASWVVVRSRIRGRALLDQLGVLPLVFPGIVLGLAVMQFYLRAPIPIYSTIWILAVAYVTRYIPYGMRYTTSGLLQVHDELEDAAATSGAGFWQTFRRILLPLLTPVIAACWMFTFLLSTKELSMSVLLSGPQSRVMAVTFFDLWNNGQITEVAAFGVIWTIALSLVTTAAWLLGRRYGLQINRT